MNLSSVFSETCFYFKNKKKARNPRLFLLKGLASISKIFLMVTFFFAFLNPAENHEQHPCKITKNEGYTYKASSCAVAHITDKFTDHAQIPPSI